jgi:long-subunit acyl-CoA synthetase (AMP-forming)
VRQIDSMTLAYAVHRLNGIATPANAAYSASELEFQLKSSGATCLFTVGLQISRIGHDTDMIK